MQFKYLRNRNKDGFTIIEVMIVLAIAGLIILIVFLAVPALERNSRNTQYKAEAARILAAALEYMGDNGGNLPICPSSSYPCNNTFPSSSDDPGRILALAGTKYITDLDEYNPPNDSTNGLYIGSTGGAYIETGVTCGTIYDSGAALLPGNGSTSSIIIVFGLENGDGSVSAHCLSSG